MNHRRKLNSLLQRSNRGPCLIIFTVGFLVALAILFLRTNPTSVEYALRKLRCVDGDVIKVINGLCSLVTKKRLTGNVCQDICKGRLVFRQCLNSQNGKYALLVDCIDSCVKGKTVSAVLKMTRVNSSSLDNFFYIIDQEMKFRFSFTKVYNKDVHLPDYFIRQENVEKVLTEKLYSEYGNKQPDLISLPNLLWKWDKNSMGDGGYEYEGYLSIVFVRTLWSLMSQGEYRVSTLFKEWEIFPQILGFCGPLYLSEYAPFDVRLDRRAPNAGHLSWREKVSKSIQVLKLIQSADSLEVPIHFCDVKHPHFGTSNDGSMRFLDADTVFTTKTLNKDLGDPQCKYHSDCAFFNCEGWCFQESGTCAPMRTNNNLQVVCAEILRHRKFSVYRGLLSNPPPSMANRLEALLNSCANDVVRDVDGIPMKTPGQNVLLDLQNLLIESLDADDME